MQRNKLRLITARPNIPETGTGGSGLQRRQIRPAIKLMKSTNVDGLESISRLSTDSTPRGLFFFFFATRGAASQQRSPRGLQARGRRIGCGSIPRNPRRIPEEMNAGVACGGGKSLPAAVSVSPGLSLICLFTMDPPAGHFLCPSTTSSTPPHSRCLPILPPPAGRASDHPLHPC